MGHRLVILSASMGAGHDAVAAELARRLTARGHRVETIDVLGLLPCGLGGALRRSYAVTIRRAPWLYQAVYRLFFVPRGPVRGGTGPVVAPMAAALRRRWRHRPPDGVVAVFHLAAQVGGRLRAEGVLPGPSAVLVTDFAVHRQWLHPGNDLYLCPTAGAADAVLRMAGRRALVVGPVVPPEFPAAFRAGAPAGVARTPDGRIPVLVSGGAWGVGRGLERTARLLRDHGYAPAVLCGRDAALRRRLAAVPGVDALGWVTDLAGLLARTAVLVDNAAGQTAVQAMAAGVPVVAYRPIAGHGGDGVRRMAEAGVAHLAHGAPGLLAALDRLTAEGPDRAAAVAAGRALLRADAAEVLADTLPATAPAAPGTGEAGPARHR